MGAHAFSASLLRASARGFAGLAAARMFERAPGLVGPAGFDAWQEHLCRQVLSLSSAVEDEAPERFAAGIAWAHAAFAARAEPAEGLGLALECLAATLEESLPPEAWAPLPEHFRMARAELERGAPEEGAGTTAVGIGAGLAQGYLDALVEGEVQVALDLVREALDARALGVPELIDTVLVPAQREIGRRWHVGELGVGEEHHATQATRRVLALALALAPRVRPRGRTVVVAAAAGDAHDLGLSFVAAHFELDGWRTLFLGADTPVADLVSFVVRHQPDLVVLGATLEEQRARTADAIRTLRAARAGQRVLVGGAAYEGRDELWRRSGADAHAADAAGAVKRGLELVGS